MPKSDLKTHNDDVQTPRTPKSEKERMETASKHKKTPQSEFRTHEDGAQTPATPKSDIERMETASNPPNALIGI
ncbi:hypothetical protein DPMN_067277 [Dreissena polymorpha]|uniref:Uncharacterized protein n=1 Tax=Dreissena polymorpha TaxID=45954 RepID=A0A9D3YXP9_DREPO|nr:hypothetical protein DPMN_067277 [Dreissena polymorpha]